MPGPEERKDMPVGGTYGTVLIDEKVKQAVENSNAKDWFYFEQDKESGKYRMMPTMPEYASAEPGGKRFKLRENVNRMAKGIASKFITADGNVDFKKGLDFVMKMEQYLFENRAVHDITIPEGNQAFEEGIDWFAQELFIPDSEKEDFKEFCRAAFGGDEPPYTHDNFIDVWQGWAESGITMEVELRKAESVYKYDTENDEIKRIIDGCEQAKAEIKEMSQMNPADSKKHIAVTQCNGNTRCNQRFAKKVKNVNPNISAEKSYSVNIKGAYAQEGEKAPEDLKWDEHYAPVVGSFQLEEGGDKYYLTIESYAPAADTFMINPGMTGQPAIGIYRNEKEFQDFYLKDPKVKQAGLISEKEKARFSAEARDGVWDVGKRYMMLTNAMDALKDYLNVDESQYAAYCSDHKIANKSDFIDEDFNVLREAVPNESLAAYDTILKAFQDQKEKIRKFEEVKRKYSYIRDANKDNPAFDERKKKNINNLITDCDNQLRQENVKYKQTVKFLKGIVKGANTYQNLNEDEKEAFHEVIAPSGYTVGDMVAAVNMMQEPVTFQRAKVTAEKMGQRQQTADAGYQTLVNDFIKKEGIDTYLDIINREKAVMRQAIGTQAFANSPMMLEPGALDDELQMRKWEAQSQGLSESGKEVYQQLHGHMRDILNQVEDLKEREIVIACITRYYEKEAGDYRRPAEATEQLKKVNKQADAVLLEIRHLNQELVPAKAYGAMLMNGLMGNNDKAILSGDTSGMGRPEWKTYLFQQGKIKLDGQQIIDGSTELDQLVKDASIPLKDKVIMNVQAFHDGFGKEFADTAQSREWKKLSDENRVAAAQNFDIAMNAVFDTPTTDLLKERGENVFDYVFIDGVSMNELYASKYQHQPFYQASENMKCEFLADAAAGKAIDILVPNGAETKILPFTIQSDFKELKKAEIPQMQPEERVQKIKAHQEYLKRKTDKEIDDRKMRMVHDTPPAKGDFSSLKEEVISWKPVFKSEKHQAEYLRMRIPEGKAGGLSNLEQNKAANGFDNFVRDLGYTNEQMAFFGQYGMGNSSELFYIDGKPAVDYVKGLYPNDNFDHIQKDSREDYLIRAEIFGAVLSGKHRIEAVTLGVDEKGAYQVAVNQVKPDLIDFDKTAKFYQTKPSKQVQSMFEKDGKREERLTSIKNHFSQKLAAQINHTLYTKEEAYRKEVLRSREIESAAKAKNQEKVKPKERLTFKDMENWREGKERKSKIVIGQRPEKKAEVKREMH